MHRIPELSRPGLLNGVRLHHLTFSLGALFWNSGAPGLGGTWSKGEYGYHNGSGDNFSVTWDEQCVVALVFFHESSKRSQWDRAVEARDPYVHLGKLPPAARALADHALGEGFMCERLVTAGFFADDESGYMAETWQEAEWHGYRAFDRFRMSPHDALLGKQGQSWLELSSISPTHADVLLEILAAGEGGKRVELKEKQRAALLAPVDGREFAKPRLAEAAAAFAAADVHGLA